MRRAHTSGNEECRCLADDVGRVPGSALIDRIFPGSQNYRPGPRRIYFQRENQPFGGFYTEQCVPPWRAKSAIMKEKRHWPNGTGQALIRRGKTNAEGQGRAAYLSRETVKWLNVWLDHAEINEGPIFRRLIGRNGIGDALHPGSVAPIFKRVAQWIGMPARFVDEVSGHSTRVGAAQDLAELDIDLAAITQAGGWKSPRMPLQYAENINAARSGMARAAAASGRDKPVSE